MSAIDRQLSDLSDESESEVIEESPAEQKSTAHIRVNLNDEKSANIVYNALVVDKEPRRSNAIRNLSVDKSFIVADITCSDPKYLQKSANNFFEMCELSRSVVELVGAYKYKEPSAVPSVKSKSNTKTKKNRAKERMENV